MRVVVPATPAGLHPRTVPAILEAGYWAEVWPMLGAESYFHLIAGLWARAEDSFVLVEHDIEVHPGALESLERCPEGWCAFSYEVYAGDLAAAYGGPFGLGCTRFRRELLEAYPHAVAEAGEMDIHPLHKPRSYAVMDSTLTQVLRGPHRLQVHQHHPNVTHHHRYMRDGAYTPQAR